MEIKEEKKEEYEEIMKEEIKAENDELKISPIKRKNTNEEIKENKKNKYIRNLNSCEIKIADKESMDIEIDDKFILPFKGKIKLANIYEQIPASNGYSAEETPSNLSDLKSEKFNIYKDKESYNFDIATKATKKEKHFITSF